MYDKQTSAFTAQRNLWGFGNVCKNQVINKHTFIEKNNDLKFSKNNLTGLLSDSTPALCTVQKSFENAFLIPEFELRFQTDFRTT